MTLADMCVNQKGIISEVDSACLIKRRLFDMGFVKGNNVCCVFRNPLGSPIAYRIDGSIIALRKPDAQMVGVIL